MSMTLSPTADPSRRRSGPRGARIEPVFEAEREEAHEREHGEGHVHGPDCNHGPAPAAQPVKAEPKVGRNDPCPCGSGKKYKKCHGA